ncbi:ribbon-helix-helix domain-containing protein [Micromonospora sp. RTGN7]|uniref:ribbon-helix-helix domain-containing protein n=1 Tax=Micromonospora sp. RTGN7 TaxID=3016526 RepID=UPI0029FF28C7|nr:Arc family DNA-binding protein [Micromonospora sp. RTGN7]
MVTTVNLPDGLHERLKQLADQERRSMNATIVVAVEEYVSAHSRRSRVRDLAREVAERDAELLRRLAE